MSPSRLFAFLAGVEVGIALGALASDAITRIATAALTDTRHRLWHDDA